MKLPIRPTQNKYELKMTSAHNIIAPINKIKFTIKVEPNWSEVGLKLCFNLLVKCFVSIPLAVKQHGVTIPKSTGTNAGTLKSNNAWYGFSSVNTGGPGVTAAYPGTN